MLNIQNRRNFRIEVRNEEIVFKSQIVFLHFKK